MTSQARLPYPWRDEIEVIASFKADLDGALGWGAMVAAARPRVQTAREHPAPFWALESRRLEYPISNAKVLALMRVAEVLRARRRNVDRAVGRPALPCVVRQHRVLAQLSTSAIALSKPFFCPRRRRMLGLFKRLGACNVNTATLTAIRLYDRQFVLGCSIDEATKKAGAQCRGSANLRLSNDMP